MKALCCLVASLFFLLTQPRVIEAQTSFPNEIHALRITDPIKLDGDLSEESWGEAPHISNFTQRELREGEPATERTEVAILYDADNLYVGVWCYDSEPGKLVAQKMKRDFEFFTEDDFEMIIDTYHDKRNGYLFVTNPNAARADALVLDNGMQMNMDWDGVWDVKTRITTQGWFAEFVIPFSTLKFSRSIEQVWGINFERNVRRKREQVMWQGWSRDSELEQVSRAGLLKGINNIQGVRLVELKPYGKIGVEDQRDARYTKLNDLGGDLNYLITPTMKLNLTLNTDFAQVESDKMQVNLTRFSLFYPEKREFFLEGRNYFDFGLGYSIQPFYTRRIGLAPDRSEIPIIAGARLLGKKGNATLGGMSIQTARKDTIPSTNYTVLRWKEDILHQSSIGIIGVGKFEPERTNAVYGADFLYSTSSFFGDKTLSLGGALAQSYTSDRTAKTGTAHRLFLDYPNDLVDFSAIWDRSSADFNPETGFLRRERYQMYNADLRIKPRPRFLPFIQQFEFKPMDFNYYVDDQTRKLQSLWTEFRPMGFETKSGERFEFNIQRMAENLTEDFDIHEGILIPTGEYWFTRYELQLESFKGRPFYAEIFTNWGDSYDGTRAIYAAEATWRMNRHFSLQSSYARNDFHLAEGDFTVNEASGRVEFAFNPDLFGSVFGQWNDEENEALLNLRINWIPKPGANFYFVINQVVDTRAKTVRLEDTTAIVKLVWRFVL